MLTFKLNNGIAIPAIGFGTYKLPEGTECVAAIKMAIESGYRLIDCAAAYGNERSVGVAIEECGVDRNELFVTSKVWAADRGYDSTLRAFEKSVTDLKLDYLDLYLIHWPADPAKDENWREINAQTWRALERLLAEGRVKAIGVSNFMPVHLNALIDDSEIIPAVNQIEYNPGCQQHECVALCRLHNIIVEAWSPLGRGRVLDNPSLDEIAKRHHKSTAQICLRWEFQQRVVSLPKSANRERIEQNIDIFDFELSADEMGVIDSLQPFGQSGLAPDNVAW